MRLKPAFLTQISALHMSTYKLSGLHLVPKCPAHIKQRHVECCSGEHTSRRQPSSAQRFARIWTSRPTGHSLKRPEPHHNKNKVSVTPKTISVDSNRPLATFQSDGISHYLKIRISVTTNTTKGPQPTAWETLFRRTSYCLGPKNTMGRQVLKGARGICFGVTGGKQSKFKPQMAEIFYWT